jgi:hypothetical protein
MGELVPVAKIENRIFQIRGKRIMFDRDLAEIYGVETRILIQAVKRNYKRFPEDFMFQLTKEETASWRSQIVISNWGRRRYLPYAFTQEGVAMLSGVLNSERAIHANIQIMRAFVSLRRVALTYSGLKRKIDDMEKKYDAQFGVVFRAIKQLIEPPPEPPKRRIGFK